MKINSREVEVAVTKISIEDDLKVGITIIIIQEEDVKFIRDLALSTHQVVIDDSTLKGNFGMTYIYEGGLHYCELLTHPYGCVTHMDL